ncbi:hypothetical protein CesoFtcFv8_001592 [Champsocephalus esox]|uniref:Uncharacterized protein n=1 Tax=Champsocephalus esox TaxID=159716 RepID=A0AAN8D3S1_9TELE|nr:hypothetical protein CesoFtcFv8_001592 [Champsocephalus esox]
MFCRLRAARPSVADSSGGRERGGEPHQRCRCVRSNPSPPSCYNTHCRRSGWIYWGVCCSWRRRTTAAARLRDSSEPRDPPARPAAASHSWSSATDSWHPGYNGV